MRNYICLVTVIYSINKNINIGGHVLIQTIAISLLTIYIDYKIGFKAWVNRLSNTNHLNGCKPNHANFDHCKP